MTPRRRGAPRRRRETPVLDAPAARRAAFDLLARKAWTRLELTRRIERRGAPEDVARAVVEDLGARGYLDDESFARWWAEARARSRQVGSVRLRQELLAKGVPRDLAAAAVDAAFEETAEVDRALAAGRRRLASLVAAGRDRAPARLGAYLLRRGYPASVVSRAVKTLTGEAPADPFDDGAV